MAKNGGGIPGRMGQLPVEAVSKHKTKFAELDSDDSRSTNALRIEPRWTKSRYFAPTKESPIVLTDPRL
jgi:hypothetical protein